MLYVVEVNVRYNVYNVTNGSPAVIVPSIVGLFASNEKAMHCANSYISRGHAAKTRTIETDWTSTLGR